MFGSGALAGVWLLCCAAPPGGEAWPMPEWTRAAPQQLDMDEGQLRKARDYALRGAGAGCVVRRGKMAASWGNLYERFDLKSTTKSFGSIALGLAVADGKLRLEDAARRHHPGLGLPPDDNARTGWLDELTILQLASQTAGFEKPGGYTKLLFRPGTQWDYSDAGPNWLAECLTKVRVVARGIRHAGSEPQSEFSAPARIGQASRTCNT